MKKTVICKGMVLTGENISRKVGENSMGDEYVMFSVRNKDGFVDLCIFATNPKEAKEFSFPKIREISSVQKSAKWSGGKWYSNISVSAEIGQASEEESASSAKKFIDLLEADDL